MTPIVRSGAPQLPPASTPRSSPARPSLDLPVRKQITPLSKPTSSALRSSVVIPTFPSILREIVHNSLDAQATRIDIWLTDPGTSYTSLRVDDDGCGVSSEGLRAVGKRGRSGKAVNPTGLGGVECYGFRGEALASIGALGILEITSKTTESKDTFRKIIKNGKMVYHGKASQAISKEHGTTVLVKDLFDKIPVRQRTLASSGTSIPAACRKAVETLALVHPHVKWNLCEDNNVGTSEGRSKRVLSVHSCKSSADVFRSLYGNAGVERVQKIRVSSGDRRVEGFISLGSSVTKAHQHLYVNSFPLDRCELHQAISKRFAQSRFSAMTADGLVEYDHNPLRRSPRRLERYPIYVLNVFLPPEEVDNAYGPAKTAIGYNDLNSIQGLILAVVDEFLKRHDFTSIKAAHVPLDASHALALSPSKASRKQTPSLAKETPTPRRPEAATPSATPLNDRMDRLFTPRPCTPCDANRSSVPPRPNKRPKIGEQTPLDDSSLRVVNKEWLDNLIRDAEVDVYGYPEPDGHDHDHFHRNAFRHPALDSGRRSKLNFEPLEVITFSSESLRSAHVLGQIDRKFIVCSLNGTLKTGDTGSSTRRVLVLIDQHAADERASLEPLLDSLCRGFLADRQETTELKTPVQVILTREEMRVLSQSGIVDILGHWGIHFDLPSLDPESVDFSQIRITHVPTGVESRLGRKETVEITRLFRDYLPFAEEHQAEIEATLANAPAGVEDSSDGISTGPSTLVDWERAMRWMPKEMLELANSKACRNAIMFQDILDLDQCQRLVYRLSCTRNPFICAHGRPSLVPITVLSAPAPQPRRSIDWVTWAGNYIVSDEV